MSIYKRTPGEINYLRKRFARERDLETCCDCPGGDDCPISCKGFVRNCTCDHPPPAPIQPTIDAGDDEPPF